MHVGLQLPRNKTADRGCWVRPNTLRSGCRGRVASWYAVIEFALRVTAAINMQAMHVLSVLTTVYDALFSLKCVFLIYLLFFCWNETFSSHRLHCIAHAYPCVLSSLPSSWRIVVYKHFAMNLRNTTLHYTGSIVLHSFVTRQQLGTVDRPAASQVPVRVFSTILLSSTVSSWRGDKAWFLYDMRWSNDLWDQSS